MSVQHFYCKFWKLNDRFNYNNPWSREFAGRFRGLGDWVHQAGCYISSTRNSKMCVTIIFATFRVASDTLMIWQYPLAWVASNLVMIYSSTTPPHHHTVWPEWKIYSKKKSTLNSTHTMNKCTFRQGGGGVLLVELSSLCLIFEMGLYLNVWRCF